MSINTDDLKRSALEVERVRRIFEKDHGQTSHERWDDSWKKHGGQEYLPRIPAPRTMPEQICDFIRADETRINERCVGPATIQQIKWSQEMQLVHVRDLDGFKEDYGKLIADIKTECDILRKNGAIVRSVAVESNPLPQSLFRLYDAIEITVVIQYWKPEA